jgi:hypothetical protein
MGIIKGLLKGFVVGKILQFVSRKAGGSGSRAGSSRSYRR